MSQRCSGGTKIPESSLGWIKYRHFFPAWNPAYFWVTSNYFSTFLLQATWKDIFSRNHGFLLFHWNPPFYFMSFLGGGRKGVVTSNTNQTLQEKHLQTAKKRRQLGIDVPCTGMNITSIKARSKHTNGPGSPATENPTTETPKGSTWYRLMVKGNSGEVAPPFGCFLKPCK